MTKEELEQLKEEISKMTKGEQIRQLEWSDHHEFSYGYAYYLLEEKQQLKERINKAIEYMERELGYLQKDGFKAFGDLDYAQEEVEELYKILKGGD